MKHKANGRVIWPVHLPKIQRHIIKATLDAATTDTDPSYRQKHRDNAHLLEKADLWWVSKPMAILASHAKEDLPAGQSLTDNRPSLAGIIIYEGGTGITTDWIDAPDEAVKTNFLGQKIYPTVEITGLVWVPGMVLGLTSSHLVPTQGKDDRVFAVPLGASAQQKLEKMLITTWLLSEQPHIGVSHPWRGESYQQAHRSTPTHQGEIKIIKLRDTPTHPETWESEQTEAGKKWALTHRTVVSGHWRNQPYGQGLASRKLIYIEPYLKGPSGAPIIVRPTVKVWSR